MCGFYLIALTLMVLNKVSCHYDDYTDGYYYEKALPQDVMVDVINNFGIALLEAHNENNNNNIALSPYGATSVLIALGEGLRGYAVQEIQEAARIPQDVSVIRVGLRDIHRHLKSYFIPKEGFLAGLTLNNERVRLNDEYKEILRFYGFDLDSFNIPLYPDVFETSTETVMNVTESSTTDMKSDLPSSAVTEQSGTTKVIEKFTESASESTTNSLVTEKDDITTEKVDLTTEKIDLTTEKIDLTTTKIDLTTKEIDLTTQKIDLTTKKVDLTTEKIDLTTETTTSVQTEKTTRIQTRSTDSVLKSTQMVTSTLIPETTQAEDLKSTEAVSFSEETTSNPETSTNSLSTLTEKTTEIQKRSTESVIITTELLTTTLIPETTAFSNGESENINSNLEIADESTSSKINDAVTSTTSNPITSELITMSTNLISTSTDSITTPTELITTPKIESTTIEITTQPLNVVTTTEKSKVDDIALDAKEEFTEGNSQEADNDDDLNENNAANEDNDLNEDNLNGDNLNKDNLNEDNDINENITTEINLIENKKRSSRSIVDYIIARHYDNNLYKTNHNNNNNLYVPDENPSFLIYGTIREPNINFMRYDAVLPVAFLPLLNAIALSFPLDSKEYYLLLILPVDETGIDKLIHNMAHSMNLKDIIMSLKYAHVRAVIPSFMLKGYVVLTSSLQKLGIQRIFEPRRTDFSLMTNEKDVYVTNIEQAVTVTIRNYVNADNLPNYRNLQRVRPVLFQADHPFLYFVMDAEIHVALMAGKIVNPLNSRIR